MSIPIGENLGFCLIWMITLGKPKFQISNQIVKVRLGKVRVGKVKFGYGRLD